MIFWLIPILVQSAFKYESLLSSSAYLGIGLSEFHFLYKATSDEGDIACLDNSTLPMTIYRKNENAFYTVSRNNTLKCSSTASWNECLSSCEVQSRITVNATDSIPIANRSSFKTFTHVDNVFINNRVYLKGNLLPTAGGMEYSGYMASLAFKGKDCVLSDATIYQIQFFKMYETCTKIPNSAFWTKRTFSNGIVTESLCGNSNCSATDCFSYSERFNGTCHNNQYDSEYVLPVVIDGRGLTIIGLNEYQIGTTTTSGLSTGAIVGIVVGSVAFMGVAGLLTWLNYSKKKQLSAV